MAPQSEWTMEELREIAARIDAMFRALVLQGTIEEETLNAYLRVSRRYQRAIERSKEWE